MSIVDADIQPLTFIFGDDGLVPNNAMPLLVYKRALELDNRAPEATIEKLFHANGWGAMWRNGVYDYLHYHATVHEVLGVARGNALVRFGGDGGTEIAIAAGDVAILPAGTGHQCLSASPDFSIVGRLSARTAGRDHAADAGKPSEGAADDSAGEAASERSGAWRKWSAGQAVETRRRRLRRDSAGTRVVVFSCQAPYKTGSAAPFGSAVGIEQPIEISYAFGATSGPPALRISTGTKIRKQLTTAKRA